MLLIDYFADSDVQVADVTRLMGLLSTENVVKEKKKILQDLTRLATLEAYQPAFSQLFDRLLLALKPLLGERLLRAQTMTCLGQIGTSSATCFEALVKWHFVLLVQSKQADKRAQRLSQLSDFVAASAKSWSSSPSSKQHQSPFLHAHAPSILAYSWNLLDTKSLESLAAPLLAVTSTLAAHVPSALVHLSSQLIRTFILWGSQEVSEDVTDRFSNCAVSLVPFLHLVTPVFLETITTMLQEFSSVPLVPVVTSKKAPATGTDVASSPSPAAPDSSTTSDSVSNASTMGGNVSSSAQAEGSTEWRAILPSPSIAVAVSIMRTLIEAIGVSIWREPKLVFSAAVTLFATAREVHRTNHTFSHRYQWDVACTQLLASLSELNTSPRIPWDARTISLYSFWFGEHVATFSTMRVSKIFTLLNAHIRFLSNYVCSQPAMPNNMTPFWATDVLALRSPGRNRELAVLVHRLHNHIISQWPLDVDTSEWIPTTIFSHLKHETGTQENATLSSAKLDQALEILALQDVHLLSSFYHRFLQSPPFASIFSESKTQRLAIESGRSALKRTLGIFSPFQLLKLSPALQSAVAQLIAVTLNLSNITLSETLSSKSDIGTFDWSHLLASALTNEAKKSSLELIRSSGTKSASRSSASNSLLDATMIESKKSQRLISSILDLLMDHDASIRLDAANTLLFICQLGTEATHTALLDSESKNAILDQLVLFESLSDSHVPLRTVLSRVLLLIGSETLQQLGRSKRAQKFFPHWASLLPLALDALHPLSLGSAGDGSNLSYFGKSEFASVLALVTEAGISQSLLDRSLESIFDITRSGAKLGSSWLEKLPALSKSVVTGDGSENSKSDSSSVFELAFSSLVAQRLVRYSTSAKEHWAMWEACIFAVLTKLKPSFSNAKEFLAFLESNLMLKDNESHNGVQMMLAARSRLSFLVKLEKAISAASPGLLALPTLSSHPAAQFFKNNYSVCADWFVGVRKQAMLFSLKYGTSSDVLRHAFVRLAQFLHPSAPTNFVETPEFQVLIVSIVEGLRETQDTDSLRALHAFVSARALAPSQASAGSKRQHVVLLEVIRAALLQTSFNFETALQVYQAVPLLDSTDEIASMVSESMNQCAVALGNWVGVNGIASEPATPSASGVRSISSGLFASLLKSMSYNDPSPWSSQKLSEVQTSLNKILHHFSIEPPHNSSSFAAFVDAALYEAAIAIKVYPAADRTAMKETLEKLEILGSPFISSASASGAAYDLNLLVEKLRVARVVAHSLGLEDKSKLSSQNLKSLSLPSLTQLITLNGLIHGQEVRCVRFICFPLRSCAVQVP